jgi:CRP/FNR family cyclic AMP-dependent transcriptional regulator
MSAAAITNEAPGSIDVRAAVIARTAMFGALDREVLRRLGAMARAKSFRPDQVVFSKGDPLQGLYVIERGRVKISTTSPAGREIALNLLGDGDVFGEVALADGGARTADAVACEPTRLLVLDRTEIVPFLEANPEIMRHMLVALAQRVRWISSRFEDAAFLSLPARVAKRLLLLGEHFGVGSAACLRLTVSLPQRELASHMGVTRETINRLIQDWRDSGLIKVDRGVIVLSDLRRLGEIAGNE